MKAAKAHIQQAPGCFLTAGKPPNAPMANGDVRSEDMLKYLAKDWVLDLEVPCVQLTCSSKHASHNIPITSYHYVYLYDI